MRKQALAVYECDLSGLVAPGLDFDSGDDLGDLPVGWTTITISTRIPNPQYETLMQAKDAAAQGMLAQAGVESASEEDAAIVEMMTDAQFAPILDSVTPFLIEDTELFVHPDYVGELVKALGLDDEVDLAPSIPVIEEEEEDDEEEDEEDEEEEEDDEEGDEELVVKGKSKAVAS